MGDKSCFISFVKIKFVVFQESCCMVELVVIMTLCGGCFRLYKTFVSWLMCIDKVTKFICFCLLM